MHCSALRWHDACDMRLETVQEIETHAGIGRPLRISRGPAALGLILLMIICACSCGCDANNKERSMMDELVPEATVVQPGPLQYGHLDLLVLTSTGGSDRYVLREMYSHDFVNMSDFEKGHDSLESLAQAIRADRFPVLTATPSMFQLPADMRGRAILRSELERLRKLLVSP